MTTCWDRKQKDYQFYEREDIKIVVDLIMADQPRSIVDFATGTGMFCKMLRGAGYTGSYLGSDYTTQFVESARDNNPAETFINIDLNAPLNFRDEQFDSVTVIHGLGYQNDIDKTFVELARISQRRIYLDLWNPYVEGDAPDNLRWCKTGLACNQYNKKRFYKAIAAAGLAVTYDEFNCNEKSAVNYILRLNKWAQ